MKARSPGISAEEVVLEVQRQLFFLKHFSMGLDRSAPHPEVEE